jgi:hypothetical protein
LGQSTLGELLELGAVREAEVLAALDWLLDRQERIERTLARRHLAADGFVLYDLSSSYVEGRCCPLAKLGYSRDKKRGKAQITYGLVCSPEGQLLVATEKELEKVRVSVHGQRGQLRDADRARIAQRAGNVVGQDKMAKHFQLTINDGQFTSTLHPTDRADRR